MLRSCRVLFALLPVLLFAAPALGQVVINEVLYDNIGSDTMTFTEIAGPPGTNLDGYELVGVNGNGGADYATIDLSGNAIPANGLFVVAEDILVPNGDLVDTLVDWQNGPDQVQLRLGGATVDSLCYDSTVDLVCEGTAAVDAAAGSSLSRDANSTDTDDNSVDFVEEPTPTPGEHFGGACDAPTDVLCTPDCNNMDLILTWTNTDTYASIEIARDGVVIAMLPGGDEMHVDMGLAPGLYSYEVRVLCLNGISNINGCSVNFCPPPASPDVLITEIVDGTLEFGHPKWVEISNCGTTAVDLSFYSIGNLNNGGTTIGGGASTPLSGMLAAGDQYIYDYEDEFGTGNDTPRFFDVYGFQPDQFAGGGFINGDDVIALFDGVAVNDGMGGFTGTVLDVYGEIGQDGTGQDWEYTDSYAYRLPGAAQSATFNVADWFPAGVDALETGDDAEEIILMQTLTNPAGHDCAALCNSAENLACTSACDSDTANLTWSLAMPVDSIDVLRDGVVVGMLPGDASSFDDAGLANGTYQYEVRTNCAGGSASVFCSVSIVSVGTATNVLWCNEDNFGSTDSCQSLRDTFPMINKEFAEIGDLTGAAACLQATLTDQDVVWVMLGTYPAANSMSAAEGSALAGLAANGVNVYIEGADVWGFSFPTAHYDYDGVDGLLADGTIFGDGDDSFNFMDGAAFENVDLSGLQMVEYIQDNETGDDFTDQIAPTGAGTAGSTGTDVGFGSAGVIWTNNPDVMGELAYTTAISYKPTEIDPSTGVVPGDVIAQSWEFGGFSGDKVALLQIYSDALKKSTGTCDSCEGLRGDANGDGSINIADATYVLSYLFLMGPEPVGCVEVADTNGDGSVNIADATYTLSYLFLMGPEPVSPGFPTPACLDLP